MDVRGRDVDGFLRDATRAIGATVELPPGYWFEWGGANENQQRALVRSGRATMRSSNLLQPAAVDTSPIHTSRRRSNRPPLAAERYRTVAFAISRRLRTRTVPPFGFQCDGKRTRSQQCRLPRPSSDVKRRESRTGRVCRRRSSRWFVQVPEQCAATRAPVAGCRRGDAGRADRHHDRTARGRRPAPEDCGFPPG